MINEKYFVTLFCLSLCHNSSYVKLVFVPELVSLNLIAYTTVKYKHYNNYSLFFIIFYNVTNFRNNFWGEILCCHENRDFSHVLSS